MVVVAAAVSAATGCSAGNNTAAPTAVTVSSRPATKQAAAAPTPAVVAVSPAGVTTKVNVPARSTEDEYFQACHAAKTWMQGRQGDRHVLIYRSKGPGTPPALYDMWQGIYLNPGWTDSSNALWPNTSGISFLFLRRNYRSNAPAVRFVRSGDRLRASLLETDRQHQGDGL